MSKVVITQSNYIPWKGYFRPLKDIDYFVILDDVQYTKRDWRNRNKLICPSGPRWLTIPVKVKNKFNQKICETEISDINWGQNHWNFIKENYKNSKYFNELKENFYPLYSSQNFNMLSDVNTLFLKTIFKLLDFNFKIINSSDIISMGNKSEKLLSICKELNATEYKTGPSAQNYLDLEIFKKNNIKVSWYNYDNFKTYTQQWSDFDHKVSILDLFFNVGSNLNSHL